MAAKKKKSKPATTPVTPQATFGEKLQALRARTGLSQALFAENAKVNVGTLRQWEIGTRRNPSYSAVLQMCKFAGVTLDEFELLQPLPKQ